MHGGKGSGAPIKHGRYSKVVGRFAAAVAEAEKDPTLLDPKRRLAWLRPISERLAERVEQSDTPEFRRGALALLGENKIDELRAHLERGCENDRALERLGASIEREMRALGITWQIKLGKRQSISAADFKLMLGQIVFLIREEAPGPVGERIMSSLNRKFLGEGPREAEIEEKKA